MKKPAKKAATRPKVVLKYDLDPQTMGRARLHAIREELPRALNSLAATIRLLNDPWWRDLKTKKPIERNKAEMIALMHSELSEALEAERKGLMDDKLPTRKGVEVELADAVIRIFDYCGGHGLDIGGAMLAKLQFNLQREDHKPKNRLKAGGKRF